MTNTNNIEDIVKIADTYMAEKDFQNAINQYNIALNGEPDNDSLYYKKGMALMGLESYNIAIYNFAKAIKLSPNNAEYYFQYAEALNELRDYSQAKEMFSIANKLAPEKYPKNGIHYHSLAEELDNIKK